MSCRSESIDSSITFSGPAFVFSATGGGALAAPFAPAALSVSAAGALAAAGGAVPFAASGLLQAAVSAARAAR